MSHVFPALAVAVLAFAGLSVANLGPPTPELWYARQWHAACLFPAWFALGLWAFFSLDPVPWRCVMCGTPLAGIKSAPSWAISGSLISAYVAAFCFRFVS